MYNIQIKKLYQTGLSALKKIGIKPDAYFAYEIDANATKVCEQNHPGEIIYKGDIRNLTEKDIENMVQFIC